MEVYSPEEQERETKKVLLSNALPYAKILMFFGIGLVITGLVGFGLPYLLDALHANYNVYMALIIISSIIVLPLSFVISFKSFNPNSIAVPICYFLYTIAFGILISSALYYADASLSVMAFAITGGIMLVMGILGILVGPKMNAVFMVAMTAMLGALVLSLVNFFFMNETVYWISSFVIFGAVLLFTAFDFYHVKRIVSSRGDIGRNLAIYCAYIFYTDFIYIFIRVLAILSSRKD